MKKYIKIIIPILILILLVGIYFIFIKEDKVKESDALKFKNEYEILNNKESKSGNKYPALDISSDNIIKYSSEEEILDVLKNKTGVIYMGFPECPWCRNAVPVLLSAADSTALAKIYYLNVFDLRDEYQVVDGKLKQTKKASDNYYKILSKLNNVLDDYIVKDDSNKEYNTNEKRIYVPIVLFVKDGKVISYHTDTVSSHINGGNGYIPLNDKEKEELFNIYVEGITNILGSACDDNC